MVWTFLLNPEKAVTEHSGMRLLNSLGRSNAAAKPFYLDFISLTHCKSWLITIALSSHGRCGRPKSSVTFIIFWEAGNGSLMWSVKLLRMKNVWKSFFFWRFNQDLYQTSETLQATFVLNFLHLGFQNLNIFSCRFSSRGARVQKPCRHEA